MVLSTTLCQMMLCVDAARPRKICQSHGNQGECLVLRVVRLDPGLRRDDDVLVIRRALRNRIARHPVIPSSRHPGAGRDPSLLAAYDFNPDFPLELYCERLSYTLPATLLASVDVSFVPPSCFDDVHVSKAFVATKPPRQLTPITRTPPRDEGCG